MGFYPSKLYLIYKFNTFLLSNILENICTSVEYIAPITIEICIGIHSLCVESNEK